MVELFTPEQVQCHLDWADFLENGGLEQAQSVLRLNNMFCCLGAFAELQINRGNCQFMWESNVLISQEDEYHTRFDLVLPVALKKDLGWETSEGYLRLDRLFVENCFISMNDKMRYDFTKIAQEVRNLVQYHLFSQETIQNLGIEFTENLRLHRE